MPNKKEPLSLITVKTLLAILIFTALGTIIIGGGYIISGIQKDQAENKITKPVKEAVKPIDQKTENLKNQSDTSDLSSKTSATDGWQTYRNEEFGFEIDYPNYLIVREDSDKKIAKAIVHFCASPKWIQENAQDISLPKKWTQECYGDLSLAIFSNNEKLSLRDFIGENYNSDLKFDVTETNIEIITLKPRGQQSNKYYEEYEELGHNLEYSYWIAAYQNYVFHLVYIQDAIIDFDREKIANQMFSSFKFIEK